MLIAKALAHLHVTLYYGSCNVIRILALAVRDYFGYICNKQSVSCYAVEIVIRILASGSNGTTSHISTEDWVWAASSTQTGADWLWTLVRCQLTVLMNVQIRIIPMERADVQILHCDCHYLSNQKDSFSLRTHSFSLNTVCDICRLNATWHCKLAMAWNKQKPSKVSSHIYHSEHPGAGHTCATCLYTPQTIY